MRAVGVTQYGGPEALELVELPDPQAGTGQVRVRVRAAAVNPADVMLRDGSLADWYKNAEPPFIPGMDIAGVIDQLGPDVDPALGLRVGQPVVGIVDNHGQYGAYSQYVALPARSVTAAPAGASFAESASFLMPALTARTVLDTTTAPEPFLAAVRDGGKFASPRGLAATPGRDISVPPINVRDRVTDHPAITRLREQIETGVLPLTVAATFPAEQAAEAHRLFDAGHVRGRIILLFDA